MTTTTNLALTLPTPNVDTGWGPILNTDFTLIDNLFAAGGTGTSVGLNVGSGKTLGIGGTLILGGGDGTGTVTAPTIRGARRTGVSNAVGADLTIDAANGTGSGGSGSFIFRTAPAGTGGGGPNPNLFQNALSIDGLGRINLGQSSMDWAGGGNVTLGNTSAIGFAGTTGHIATNLYYNGAWRVNTAADAALYVQVSGQHLFYQAPAGAPGSAAALTERIRIGGAGQIGISGANYGSAGQVLTSNGSGSSVSWSTPVLNSINLLGTIVTTSGNNIPLSGINLTGCKFVYAICENVDPTVSTTNTSQFALGGANIRSASGAGDNYVIFDLTFSMAIVYSTTGMQFVASTLTTASTSIVATTSPAANFNGGTIRLYSAR